MHQWVVLLFLYVWLPVWHWRGMLSGSVSVKLWFEQRNYCRYYHQQYCLFAFVICTVSYLYCASCPYYRYRAPGAVIVTQQPQQQLVPTQAHTVTTQQVQAPLLHNYKQPSPAGYNQPPSGLHQAPPAYSPPIPNLNPSAEIKGQAVSIPPPEPAKY